MRLVLAGVATMSAFAFAAPTASVALPDAGSAATSATSAATSTASAATASAGSSVGAVAEQATKAIAPTKEVASSAAQTTAQTVSKAQPPAPRLTPPAPRVKPPATRGEPPDTRLNAPAPRLKPPAAPASSVEIPSAPSVEIPSVETPSTPDVGREIGRYRNKIALPIGDLRGVGPVDDVMTLLGNTLREIAPVRGLLAPPSPLLGGGDVLDELPDLGAVVAPVHAPSPIGVHAPSPAGGVLGAGDGPPSVPAAPPTSASSQTFQAASARPPAAEVGGRPVSPIPWTAPAPAAGGAAAVFSGAVFVPFLGLLVLAALMVPRLMRRLDELPAFVRPEPFLCALERPG